jgi:hypothetical protein
VRVHSLGEYVERIGQQLSAWKGHTPRVLEPVFRGQADAHWELVPALLRSAPYDSALENTLLDEFQRGARPFVERHPVNRLQWMALAQHHGLPTRLLDWSESAFVALFFALAEHVDAEGRGSCKHDDDACVWMLNRNALHERFGLASQMILLDDSEETWPDTLRDLIAGKSEGVLVFTAVHITARMPVQKAAFTLFGSASDTLEALRNDESLLLQLVIPRECVMAFRRELEVAGITRSMLFPDLDGVAAEVWERAVRRRWEREGSTR